MARIAGSELDPSDASCAAPIVRSRLIAASERTLNESVTRSMRDTESRTSSETATVRSSPADLNGGDRPRSQARERIPLPGQCIATKRAISGRQRGANPRAQARWPWRPDRTKSVAEMPGGVYRVGLPRSDLKDTFDGVAIKAALALGSWLSVPP